MKKNATFAITLKLPLETPQNITSTDYLVGLYLWLFDTTLSRRCYALDKIISKMIYYLRLRYTAGFPGTRAGGKKWKTEEEFMSR